MSQPAREIDHDDRARIALAGACLCFSPEQAQVSGFSARFYHIIMLAMIAITIIVSFQTVGTLLVFGMLLAPSGAGALMARERAAPPAIVAAGKTEARFAPAADATVHFQLPEGAKVAIREDRSAWMEVARADGQQGWVKSESLERVVPR